MEDPRRYNVKHGSPGPSHTSIGGNAVFTAVIPWLSVSTDEIVPIDREEALRRAYEITPFSTPWEDSSIHWITATSMSPECSALYGFRGKTEVANIGRSIAPHE